MKQLRIVAAWILLMALPVMSAPQGGSVASGQATVTQQGNQTKIVQNGQQAIINWQSFSIGSGETVQFLQPNALAVTLNRVTGIDPSIILGSLLANGKIFLINPNGVLFGQGACVNVGSLVVSTLSIPDSCFLAGNYQLRQGASQNLGFVVNQGTIKAANGGSIVLVAPLVNNSGTIVANLGQVRLAAGTQASINLDADGLMTVPVGSINAKPGDVTVVPGVATDVLSLILNTRQIVKAGGVKQCGCKVILTGAEGLAVNTGTITANGAPGQRAGSVEITSTQATVVGPHAIINANGVGDNSCGGTVRALSCGISVLSPSAQINARGGCGSGNGGFVEVSGPRVAPCGKVDTSAPHGKDGTYLIDPADLFIITGCNGAGCGDNCLVVGNGVFCACAHGCFPQLSTGAINCQSKTTNVTISSCTITFILCPGPAAGINLGANHSLTINATNRVLTQSCGNLSCIIAHGTGNVTLHAGSCLDLVCGISTVNGIRITTESGNICLRGGINCGAAGTTKVRVCALTSTSGNIDICSKGNILITAPIQTGGNVTVCSLNGAIFMRHGVQGANVTMHVPTCKPVCKTPNSPGSITFGQVACCGRCLTQSDATVSSTGKICLVATTLVNTNISATDVTAPCVALRVTGRIDPVTTSSQNIQVTGFGCLVNTSATATTLKHCATCPPACTRRFNFTQNGAGTLTVTHAGGCIACSTIKLVATCAGITLNGPVIAPGGACIQAKGAILNGGCAQVTAGNTTMKSCAIVGTVCAPIPVTVNGTLNVSAGAAGACAHKVSIDLTGTATTFTPSACVPGLVLFNQAPPACAPPAPPPNNPCGSANQTAQVAVVPPAPSTPVASSSSDLITEQTAPPAATVPAQIPPPTVTTPPAESVLALAPPDVDPLITVADDEEDRLRKQFRVSYPRQDLVLHARPLSPRHRDKRSLLRQLYEAHHTHFLKWKEIH